jgi:hypothetical protein
MGPGGIFERSLICLKIPDSIMENQFLLYVICPTLYSVDSESVVKQPTISFMQSRHNNQDYLLLEYDIMQFGRWIPAFHRGLLFLRALQSMMNLGLFYDCSPYVRLQSLKVFQQLELFTGWGRQPHAQPPTWRARVSLFVWIITFDLSGMGDPTSSYATTGIAFRII